MPVTSSASTNKDNEPEITILPDGTKQIVEYSVNDDGKNVKITRKIKTTVVKSKANHAIAERKKLPKFGESKGLLPGPDSNCTTFGDIVTLQMSQGIKEVEAVNNDALKKEALAKSKIVCRICKGDHWTSKCPYKDNHSSVTEDASASVGGSADLGKPGKYVPPSLRGKTEGAGGDDSYRERRDDSSTVRLTNLSEQSTEADVRMLVSRLGSVSRVFVSRDRDTNLCKGFAFITFIHKEDAETAVEALDGHGFDNLILRAEMANSSR